MQVNHRKVHKYLGITLYYTTVGQVKINMLYYIDEIFNVFDKEYPTGGGNKSSSSRSIILKFGKYCKTLIPSKMWSFITWWRKCYSLTSGPGRTHAMQFNSSP